MVLALVLYIYNEGKTACENSVKSAQLDDTVEVTRNAQTVKRQEQQFKTPELDKALCDLGIARGNVGCEWFWWYVQFLHFAHVQQPQ